MCICVHECVCVCVYVCMSVCVYVYVYDVTHFRASACVHTGDTLQVFESDQVRTDVLLSVDGL